MMFFSFAVVLAVTLAVVSASQAPKEEAAHSAVHFDALDVPVQAGFAAKVLKLRAAQHKKQVTERATRDAKKVSEGKKEKSTNVAQGKTVLTPVTTSYWVQKSHSNSDCSGPVVSTYIEKMNRCVWLGFTDSMRSTCSGLQVTYSYFTEEDDCTGDSYNAAENHESCDFDVYSYEAMGRILMSSNTCVDSDPALDLQSGLLIKYYDTENCVGDYAYAFNQHLNACSFMQEENGDYFYYKILGCDGERITMVGYSDRNCQRPFVKDVDPMEAPTCNDSTKTQCVVWA